MKARLLLILLFYSFLLFAQTPIDDYISIKFPEKPKSLDTILLGEKIKTYYVNDNITSLGILKLKIDESEDVITKLPYDFESLKKTYAIMMKGHKRKMIDSGYILQDSLEIEIDGFLAYKLSYSDSKTKIKNSEFIILLLNEYMYLASYISHSNYNADIKDAFLNSIQIDKKHNPSQILGYTKSYKYGYLLGKILFYGGIVFFIIWLIRKR
uniref:hypothetical protein n=2 Tax=Gelidibacter sp. TaxID=2018083 RepID=UPI004049531C